MLGRYDGLGLCSQVELRSYVSEPELTTFGGDVAQPPLESVGSESRYQTLPSRGKSPLSTEASGNPSSADHCSPTLTWCLVPFCLQRWTSGPSCTGSGLRGGPVVPFSGPRTGSLSLYYICSWAQC